MTALRKRELSQIGFDERSRGQLRALSNATARKLGMEQLETATYNVTVYNISILYLKMISKRSFRNLCTRTNDISIIQFNGQL